MTKEELINKANNGDVAAMMQLINSYADDGDWNEATDWADKAAETGDVNAMYKPVNLHGMRMHALIAMGMLSGLMPDDARAVQKNAAVLLGASKQGLINLNDEINSNLLSSLRDAIYIMKLHLVIIPSQVTIIESYTYLKMLTLHENNFCVAMRTLSLSNLMKRYESLVQHARMENTYLLKRKQ